MCPFESIASFIYAKLCVHPCGDKCIRSHPFNVILKCIWHGKCYFSGNFAWVNLWSRTPWSSGYRTFRTHSGCWCCGNGSVGPQTTVTLTQTADCQVHRRWLRLHVHANRRYSVKLTCFTLHASREASSSGSKDQCQRKSGSRRIMAVFDFRVQLQWPPAKWRHCAPGLETGRRGRSQLQWLKRLSHWWRGVIILTSASNFHIEPNGENFDASLKTTARHPM